MGRSASFAAAGFGGDSGDGGRRRWGAFLSVASFSMYPTFFSSHSWKEQSFGTLFRGRTLQFGDSYVMQDVLLFLPLLAAGRMALKSKIIQLVGFSFSLLVNP